MKIQSNSNGLVLLEHPLSPYAQKIRILLREKKIPFVTRLPNYSDRVSQDAPLKQLSPRHELPVLLHGKHVLYDSTIIIEYLEDSFPEPAMLPKTPLARARSRMIEEICDTHYEAINWGLTEVDHFKRGGPKLAPTLRASGRHDLMMMFQWLERELGNQEWLEGAYFGWADLAALPEVTSSILYGVSPPPDSTLHAWIKRARGRPSVSLTLDEAAASLSVFDGAEERLNRGFKRQYRDHRLEWMIRAGGLQVVVDGIAKANIRFNEPDRFAEHRLPEKPV